jgi:hypothetical protein
LTIDSIATRASALRSSAIRQKSRYSLASIFVRGRSVELFGAVERLVARDSVDRGSVDRGSVDRGSDRAHSQQDDSCK